MSKIDPKDIEEARQELKRLLEAPYPANSEGATERLILTMVTLTNHDPAWLIKTLASRPKAPRLAELRRFLSPDLEAQLRATLD